MTGAGLPAIDVVRRVYERFQANEIPGDLLDEDVEWHVPFVDEEGPAIGHAGVARFFRRWLGTWEDYEFGVDEIFEAPDGRVVALFWERGRGKGSGAEVRLEPVALWTVEDGRVIRYESFVDRSEGLRAAGVGPR
jgi:uncharacterized protein